MERGKLRFALLPVYDRKKRRMIWFRLVRMFRTSKGKRYTTQWKSEI